MTCHERLSSHPYSGRKTRHPLTPRPSVPNAGEAGLPDEKRRAEDFYMESRNRTIYNDGGYSTKGCAPIAVGTALLIILGSTAGQLINHFVNQLP